MGTEPERRKYTVIKQATEFLNAIRKHWGSLVTSGSLIGLLTLWQNTGHNVRTWIYWTVAIVGFGIACFKAWNDAVNKTETQVEIQKRHAEELERTLNSRVEEEKKRADLIQSELNDLRAKLNEPKIGTRFWLEERKPASHVMRYYIVGKIYNEGETISNIHGELTFQPEYLNEQQITPIERQHLSQASPIELDPRELPGQAITDRIKQRTPIRLPIQVRFLYTTQTGNQNIYEARYEYDALNRIFVLQ
ncbi:MAG TPA: hypothetical protein VGH51_16395 [Candidatus Angelobacter sp.]